MQDGRLVTFLEDTPSLETVVDVSNRLVQHRNFEVGLLGFAFHPEYPAHPWIYLSYTGPPEQSDTEATSYVTALRVDSESRRGDLESEIVLFAIPLPGVMHHGGALEFGPDGNLYVSLGDGSRSENSQDPQTLLGSLLRVDVDAGSPYVAAANPFEDGIGGRPEVFAWGLRNLWKFTFDRWTGEIWGGDVGSEDREEVNKIVAGGNYGWPIREGSLCVPIGTESCPDDRLIDPVVEFDHSEGDAVISGYVYRGSALPLLWGKLLYADFRATRLWALDVDNGARAPELLLEEGEELTSFAEDHDGEVYVLLRYGTGNLRRLARQVSGAGDDLPRDLSATGCVDEAAPTRPAAHLLGYEVNLPFWSGDGRKNRWLALPDDRTIEVRDDGDFDLPVGTVAMKSFRIAGRLVETRLFMHHPDGVWAGYSYVWDQDQRDARLLRGADERGDGPGTWAFPSRAECVQCHTAAAGRTLGLEAAQLARKVVDPRTGNSVDQIELWRRLGLFSNPDAPGLAVSRPLAGPADDADASFNAVQAYLHVNCSICHRPGGPGLGSLDLRRTSSLSEMGVCNAAPQVEGLDVPGGALVRPGDPEGSVLLARVVDEGTRRMPPVGEVRVDYGGAALIQRWITALPDCP